MAKPTGAAVGGHAAAVTAAAAANGGASVSVEAVAIAPAAAPAPATADQQPVNHAAGTYESAQPRVSAKEGGAKREAKEARATQRELSSQRRRSLP